MDEFQRKELTGANELDVVLVNEEEGEDGEEVGEYELQRSDGGRVREKIQPVSAWRRRIAVISVVERFYPVWVVVTTDSEVGLSLQ